MRVVDKRIWSLYDPLNKWRKKKKKMYLFKTKSAENTPNAEILSMEVFVEWMIFKTRP